MQPVKLGGLTLKSEPKKEEVEEIVDAASEGLAVPEPEIEECDCKSSDVEPTIDMRLRLILSDVEAANDIKEKVKIVGKLKGALQLLS